MQSISDSNLDCDFSFIRCTHRDNIIILYIIWNDARSISADIHDIADVLF